MSLAIFHLFLSKLYSDALSVHNSVINHVLDDTSFTFYVELVNTRYPDLHADKEFELQHVKKLKVVILVCAGEN